ncbi:MAG TPA: hypothetical protein VK887_04955 [Pseudonocardiaceae bacterium]|nr:hypothetical protein [Pseudonocardiaceae bacterium]
MVVGPRRASVGPRSEYRIDDSPALLRLVTTDGGIDPGFVDVRRMRRPAV